MEDQRFKLEHGVSGGPAQTRHLENKHRREEAAGLWIQRRTEDPHQLIQTAPLMRHEEPHTVLLLDLEAFRSLEERIRTSELRSPFRCSESGTDVLSLEQMF